MIHPHHFSTVISSAGIEIWTKPTRKNLIFPILVAAAAMASLLIKPLPFLSVQFFTGEFIPSLRDSISGWMTAPYLFFLVNIIIIAILAMSRFQHNLGWTERGDQIQGRVKEIGMPNGAGDQFHGSMKDNSLPNERGAQFQEREKKSSMPNERVDLFQGAVKKSSMPNERVDLFQGTVKKSSLLNETKDHFHGRVKEMRLPNESGDEFQGTVKKTSLPMPNETEDHFHGRLKGIKVPNERTEDHFETKVRKNRVPSETGEVDEEEDPEIYTNLGFLSGHGEERMLIGGRFNSRRSKGNKMGQSLRVNHVDKDRGETLESVWKKITEGRRPPLARHLRNGNVNCNGSLHKAEKAEESALQMVLARDRSGGSTGQDELNKRVEAFIAKFNRDIKLQKQDSRLGYAEMIHRGAI